MDTVAARFLCPDGLPMLYIQDSGLMVVRLQLDSFLGGSLLVVTRYVTALGWVQLEVTVSSWWFSLVRSVMSRPFFSGGYVNVVESGPFSGRNGCRSDRCACPWVASCLFLLSARLNTLSQILQL